MFVLVENDSITKTLSTSKGITIGENQYPRAIYTSWSTAEREAIGIYEVVFDNTNKKDEAYYNNKLHLFYWCYQKPLHKCRSLLFQQPTIKYKWLEDIDFHQ